MSTTLAEGRRWEVGEVLADLPITIPFERIPQVTATSGDWYRGHFDPDYAKAQGQATIFASSIHLHGLLDRFITDTFGSDTFIFRRRMRIIRSVYAGFSGVLAGEIRQVDPETQQLTIELEFRDDELRVWAEVICGVE